MEMLLEVLSNSSARHNYLKQITPTFDTKKVNEIQLEEELSKAREINDNDDFFENSTFDNFPSLDKCLLSTKRINKTESIIKGYNFKIPYSVSVINNFYLVFELTKLDLDFSEKMKLLNETVELSIDSFRISTMHLSINIALSTFYEKFIIEEDNIIKIPLFFLIIFKSNYIPIYRINNNLSVYHNSTQRGSSDWNRSVSNVYLEYDCYEDMSVSSFEKKCDIVSFNTVCCKSLTYWMQHEFLRLNLSCTKMVFFSFPKIADTYYDYKDRVPTITKIEMKLNGYGPLIFEGDTLYSFELFGVSYYSIPLTPEFSNWDDIKEWIQNIHINGGGKYSLPLDRVNNVSIKLYDNNTPILETISITSMEINSIMYKDSLCGTIYIN